MANINMFFCDYSNTSPFVTMSTKINFLETFDVASMQDQISQAIYESTETVRFDEIYIGNRVGNLLIYYDSLARYQVPYGNIGFTQTVYTSGQQWPLSGFRLKLFQCLLVSFIMFLSPSICV